MRNEHNPSGSEKSKFKPIEKLLAAGGALALAASGSEKSKFKPIEKLLAAGGALALAASLSACGPEKAGKAGAESNPETTTSVETETPLTPKDPTPAEAESSEPTTASTTDYPTPEALETEMAIGKYKVPEFRDIRQEWKINEDKLVALANLRGKPQNDYTMKQQAIIIDEFVRDNNPQWENPYPELIEGSKEAIAEGKDPQDAQYSVDGTLLFTDAVPDDGGYDPQGLIDSWLITYNTIQQCGVTCPSEADVILESWKDLAFKGDNAENLKEMFERSYSYERDLFRSGNPESIEKAYVSFDKTVVQPVQVLDMSGFEIKKSSSGERYVAMDLVMVKKAEEEGDGVASDRIFAENLGVSEWSRSIGFYGRESIDDAVGNAHITTEKYAEYLQFTTEETN